jgi:chromosomal replication initiator protein
VDSLCNVGESCYLKTMTAPGKLRIDNILRTVADYYGVECEGVVSKSKSKTLTHSRHVAMFLIRRLTEHSLPEIGRSLNRDHTVVLHGVRRIEALLQSDEKLKADIELLSARFSLHRVA